MKTTTILNCLLLLIPFNALAHPGHAGGAVFAGLTSGQLLSVSSLIGGALLFAAARLYQRRKSARADD